MPHSGSSDAVVSSSKLCVADGCDVALASQPRYCQQRGLCTQHMKADAIHKKDQEGQLWRFCQQCGKLEKLEAFDGHKRSCRVQLARRRAASFRQTSTAQGALSRTDSTAASASAGLRPLHAGVRKTSSLSSLEGLVLRAQQQRQQAEQQAAVFTRLLCIREQLSDLNAHLQLTGQQHQQQQAMQQLQSLQQHYQELLQETQQVLMPPSTSAFGPSAMQEPFRMSPQALAAAAGPLTAGSAPAAVVLTAAGPAILPVVLPALHNAPSSAAMLALPVPLAGASNAAAHGFMPAGLAALSVAPGRTQGPALIYDIHSNCSSSLASNAQGSSSGGQAAPVQLLRADSSALSDADTSEVSASAAAAAGVAVGAGVAHADAAGIPEAAAHSLIQQQQQQQQDGLAPPRAQEAGVDVIDDDMFDRLLAEELESLDQFLFGGGSGEVLQQGNGIAAGGPPAHCPDRSSGTGSPLVMEPGRDSTTPCGNPCQQQLVLQQQQQLVEVSFPVMTGALGGGGAGRGFAAGLDQASAPPAAQRMAGLAGNDAEDFPGLLDRLLTELEEEVARHAPGPFA